MLGILGTKKPTGGCGPAVATLSFGSTFGFISTVVYAVLILVILRPFDKNQGVFQEDHKCTSVSHVHDGVRTWSQRC